jgi:hypothetical protein
MLSATSGCGRSEREAKDDPVATPKPEKPSHVEIVTAPPGAEDVTAVVRREAERAHGDGHNLVLYVGAQWCEPCQRFHEAARAGKLDAAFPRLRLLEFDLDRDQARLGRAGCSSKLIPLFARPDAEGRCSNARVEGSIKGDAAVADIAPRLAQILAAP